MRRLLGHALVRLGNILIGHGVSVVSSTPSQQWIIDGSEVQQAPEGPTVIWAVNGSSVSNTEV